MSDLAHRSKPDGISFRKYLGVGFLGSALWSLVRWVLEDYGYIALGGEALANRGRIVNGLWSLVSHAAFGPAVAVGCLAIYLILEFRSRRTSAHRLPAAPTGPDVKGFLDYKIEARQAFEDVLAQLGSYVDVHTEWTEVLASALAKAQKIDAKGAFLSDKKRDLQDLELLKQTAARLDGVTARFEAYVAGLDSAVERLAANQVEYFKFVLEHDLERESLKELRDQFLGFKKCYRLVRDRQIGWCKAITDSPGQTKDVIQAGRRYVAVLNRSIAAYTLLDEHVDRMVALLDRKLKAPDPDPVETPKSPIPDLRELFLSDFSTTLRMHRPVEIHWKAAEGAEGDVTVTVQTYLDFAAGSRFVGFFVGAHPHAFEVIRCIASGWDALSTVGMEGLDVFGGHVGQLQTHSIADLKTSGRVLVYHESSLSAHQIAAIEDAFTATGASVILRGHGYAFSRRTA
jgi:hypothetical protein